MQRNSGNNQQRQDQNTTAAKNANHALEMLRIFARAVRACLPFTNMAHQLMSVVANSRLEFKICSAHQLMSVVANSTLEFKKLFRQMIIDSEFGIQIVDSNEADDIES
jgi:hypothetical protein